ncbi:peptide ABC transporter permease [Jeotgalibacillus salarius]|uniref:Peptide ABC transporter permease n=1 Tax=Jeotgalibacillus salarius TaxID=546023 RepID=A0A4Y8LFZ8_9BACL|nr:peptide ABC transporter permease [Jeotgalibacillus salarius]TFE01734.1 peptide ABC transporter permease [Jeotgalibacillus salarius]
MIHFTRKLKEKLETANLDLLWPGFRLTAYAIYSQEYVYLFNHPVCQGEDEPLIFEWDKRFVGNTLILFEDVPTAIVNVEKPDSLEDTYPVLVHELFHGYQTLMNEKRFPDELLGVQYPLLEENIGLRLEERTALRSTLDASSIDEKRAHLKRFITLREKRKELLGESLEYENLIETIEGPAWYVEMKAYASLHQQRDAENCYKEKLLHHEEAGLHLRKSCYSSGLALCLLLDEIFPEWKQKYFYEDCTLYDCLKEKAGLCDEVLNNSEGDMSNEAARIYQLVQESRQKTIQSFSDFDGYQLTIEGPMRAVFFDPMNMVNVDHQLLHQYFVTMQIQEQEYLINQPALTHYTESVLHADKLQLNLNKKPVMNQGIVNIPGIGDFKGDYSEEGKQLKLLLS